MMAAAIATVRIIFSRLLPFLKDEFGGYQGAGGADIRVFGAGPPRRIRDQASQPFVHRIKLSPLKLRWVG
ncbi:hypothetical protein BURKHO8Y_20164 [Burkholderia sp. 8Y]|nr:hypothetical protein BURKHO8Y_20164 [Burkholderia sp. 8Y]